MNLANIRVFFVLVLCLIMAAACVNDRKATPSRSPATSPGPAASSSSIEPPDVRPVVDSAPYWCDMVPKEAFRRVSGVAGNLVEHWSARRVENGSCIVRDSKEYGPLSIGWLKNGAKKKVSGRMKDIRADLSNEDLKMLPTQLGFGFTAFAPSELESAPYVAAVVFHCGGDELSLNLDLRRVSQGRDATGDLTDLMRIAQQRFGKIHHCMPRP
jgi:hypothetical protein